MTTTTTIVTGSAQSRSSKRSGAVRRAPWILLAPFLLLFLLTFVLPIVVAIGSSFTRVTRSGLFGEAGVTSEFAWFDNYAARPWLWVAPGLGLAGAALAGIALRTRSEGLPILASGLSIFGVISTVGVSMFPFILPSTIDPRSSLTVWDSSSSHLTLFIMLFVTVLFLPIILAYTAWVYRVLWGKVTEAEVRQEAGHFY